MYLCFSYIFMFYGRRSLLLLNAPVVILHLPPHFHSDEDALHLLPSQVGDFLSGHTHPLSPEPIVHYAGLLILENLPDFCVSPTELSCCLPAVSIRMPYLSEDGCLHLRILDLPVITFIYLFNFFTHNTCLKIYRRSRKNGRGRNMATPFRG
jgi:hypothetical protein